MSNPLPLSVERNHDNFEQDLSIFPRSALIANRSELTHQSLNIQGELPSDLKGHIYIVGPAGSVDSLTIKDERELVLPVHRNGISIFNGDGMIYRLDFEDGKNVLLTTRLAKTPCYYVDKGINENRDLPGTFRFQSIGLMRFSPTLGVRTQGNTMCMPVQFANDPSKRILLTSDTGRPYEIDPRNLNVITPIGSNSEWKDIKMPIADGPFKMFGSAAHPVFDENTQEFFTVNWSKSITTMLTPVDLSIEKLEPLLKHLPNFIRKKHRKVKLIKWINDRLGLDDIFYFLQGHILKEGEMSDFFKPYVSSELLIALKEVEKVIICKSIKDIDELLNNISSAFEEAISIFGKIRDMEDFVYLVRWHGEGSLQSWQVLIEENGSLKPVHLDNSLHQIGITEDYIILMDTTFKVGVNQVFGKNFPKWENILKILRKAISHTQSIAPNVYCIRRSDLEVDCESDKQGIKTVIAKKVSLPQEVAHFAVDHSNPSGKVTLHVAHNCAWDPAEWIQPYDEIADFSKPINGFPMGSTDINKLGKYIIDVENEKILNSSLVSDSELTWSTAIYTHSPAPDHKINDIFWLSWGSWKEFQAHFILDLYRDYPLRDISLEEVLLKTSPSNIVRLNTDSMKIEDAYKFPGGYFGNSPQFVPRSGVEEDAKSGYIICVVFNATEQDTSDTEIWIFDASTLSKGPICKLSHPTLKFGMTVHSTWIPTAQSSQSSYRIPIREDYASLLGNESSELQELFEKHVFPNFE